VPERRSLRNAPSGPFYGYAGLFLLLIAGLASLARRGNPDPSTAGTILIGLIGAGEALDS